MSMVINTKKWNYCAMCKYCDGVLIKNYEPRTGVMSVDNSGNKCRYYKKGVSATQKACANFSINPSL